MSKTGFPYTRSWSQEVDILVEVRAMERID